MSFDRHSRERLLKLLSALADDELNGLQREEMASLLHSDAQARQLYIQYTTLQSLVRREAARHGALLEIARRADYYETASPLHRARSRPFERARLELGRSGKWRITGKRSITGLAVVVALVTVGLTTWNRIKPTSRWACELIGAQNCTWQQGTQPALGGHFSSGEQLNLLSGRAALRFVSGVQITLDGPSRLRINSQSNSFLELGQLTATVPVAGRGFSVATPSMTIVDLGTQFGVRVDSQGAAEVQVFRGAVDAQPATSLASAKGPVRLLANQAAVSNTEKGLLAVGPIEVVGSSDFRPLVGDSRDSPRQPRTDHERQDEIRQPRQPANFLDEPRGSRVRSTRGSIRQLIKPPASVAVQDLKDDRNAFVFLESAAVVLREDLPVNLTAAGRFDNVQGQHGTLPQGARVDCYLIHFCSPAGDAHCSGAIEFSDRVLAIVAGKQILQATDSVFGSPTTKYVPTGSNRQIEEGDIIELSADRRTLSLDWKIKAGVDQVRILVATPEAIQ